MLKSAITALTVTEADLNYIGSITIDEDLAERANLKAGENVMVINHTNGLRLETYVITGKKGSGVICMNGAAAHLIHKGDKITVMSFALDDEDISPRIIIVNEENRFMRYI